MTEKHEQWQTEPNGNLAVVVKGNKFTNIIISPSMTWGAVCIDSF